MDIFKRFPDTHSIISVYVLIIVFPYGWALYYFFWKLPSWLYYLSVGKISIFFAYTMALNFLESLVLLAAPVFWAFILPSKWFKENFIPAGGLYGLFLGCFLMYFSGHMETLSSFTYSIVFEFLGFIVLAVPLSVGLSRVRFLARLVSELADRATIFLYIIIPVSLLSILVVIVRNLI